MNDTEGPFGKSHRIRKRGLDLRSINSAKKFGAKNPTENGKFLLVIFLDYLLRNTFFKNGICVLSSSHNKNLHRDQCLNSLNFSA